MLGSGAYFENLAFGHGIGNYMQSRDLRIENENFSSQNTNTQNGTITIRGTLVSLSDYEIKSPLRILLTSEHEYDPLTKGIHDLTLGQLNYKPHDAAGRAYEHQSYWYFTVEPYPSEISLKPGEVLDYKIIIHPLKAGTYHVHTLLTDTTQYTAPGQTIHVEGSNQITHGEFWELYVNSILVLSIIVGFFVLIPYLLIRRKFKQRKIEKNLL